ncbi:MAG: hypothetical protein GOVbin1096_30 [Prokaryotic dsDNA virus sp.]|jgi:ABC-type uncharacterized transport system permease subunit|nr:MAG: hypothetical protein GOVbin1096_30 [Prokaryotic dsDNA virus sp.]|tara:strand:+ start:52444 stop:52674 length:231 start_codon:yes stop_codon:yes gene_type:complete
MKDTLINLRDWFWNQEVPIIDKICAVVVLFVVVAMVCGLIFAFIVGLFVQTKAVLTSLLFVSIVLSFVHILVKYID